MTDHAEHLPEAFLLNGNVRRQIPDAGNATHGQACGIFPARYAPIASMESRFSGVSSESSTLIANVSLEEGDQLQDACGVDDALVEERGLIAQAVSLAEEETCRSRIVESGPSDQS